MGRLRNALSALFAPPAPTPAPPGSLPKPGSGYGQGYGGRIYSPMLPDARANYADLAGDLWRNTTVAACLGWLQDNVGQACLDVVEPGKNGAPDDKLEKDPAAILLRKPNPYMTVEELLGVMLLSDTCDGNTYLLKARGMGGLGAPEELWWVPPWMMVPWAANGSANYVDAYQYQPGTGGVYYLPVDQVIHIKNGVDPYNLRLGCARLKHGVRNIVGLNRAETYTVGIVTNGGPVRLFIPKIDGIGEVQEDEAEGIKKKIRRAQAGENAGSVNVLTVDGHVEAIGSGPQEMALDTILDRPESNVCALTGVHPQSVGLACGQGTQTYANFEQAEAQTWKNGLIPRMKRFANGLTQGLLRPMPGDVPADFEGTDTRVFKFDYSAVQALSEDETEKVTRAVMAVGGPIWTVDEGRKTTGHDPIPGGDLTPEDKAEQAAEIAKGQDPDAEGNGNAGNDPAKGTNADE